MALQRNADYGYVSDDDIEKAIQERLQSVVRKGPEHTAQLLGEAVAAILAVNSAIPVHSNQRHLVAQALERFADGTSA